MPNTPSITACTKLLPSASRTQAVYGTRVANSAQWLQAQTPVCIDASTHSTSQNSMTESAAAAAVEVSVAGLPVVRSQVRLACRDATLRLTQPKLYQRQVQV